MTETEQKTKKKAKEKQKQEEKIIKKIKKFKSGSIFIQFNREIKNKDDEKEFLKRLEETISSKKLNGDIKLS